MKQIIRYYRITKEINYKIVNKKGESEIEEMIYAFPKGCIMAIGPGQVGWSFCNHKDSFNYKMAKVIAYGRALKSATRPRIKERIPEELIPLFKEVENRSYEIWEKDQ